MIGLGAGLHRQSTYCEPVTAGETETMRPSVLVVEDDQTVRDVVRRYLEHAGMSVVEAADGRTGLALAHSGTPDLVVLDLMLPGMSGLDLCRELRRSSTVPVVMLTALGEEADRVAGLELGADDYIVKPFSPRELTLRVTRILERAQAVPQAAPAPAGVLIDGDLVLNEAARSVSRGGSPLALTGREYDLLSFFLHHPGQVFTRAELMEKVWQWTFGDQSTVTVHVRRLREKIESDPGQPTRIATVWGVGYRFDPAA
jgi:DNA-binding response OmpR family regulator